MRPGTRPASDVAFTDTVKAIQSRKGSRDAYARMEASGGWETDLTDDLRAFVEAQTSVFLATVNADGQPYIQHRGGPPGFLRVIDAHTIAFVDFAGNRQYVTQGNLQENDKAHLFLIDYAHRRRIKLWGTARIVEGDEALIATLMTSGYRAKPEQVLLFTVVAWDANCPQHIPIRVDVEQVREAIETRDRRIADLESALRALRPDAP